MGGGLAFLNKKGFHTGTMQNQERVWKVEQQKKAEEAKLEEIKKQIAEERQVMELQDAQMGADGKKKRKEQRLGWLYEVPMSGNDADQEQYLLGSKDATEHENLKGEQGDLERVEEMQAPGALWMHQNANAAQEMAMKIRDDPLLAIRRQEERAKRSVLQNPVEMLKRKLAAEAARLEQRKAKKHKKDKKHKKEKKGKRKKREKKSKKTRKESHDDRKRHDRQRSSSHSRSSSSNRESPTGKRHRASSQGSAPVKDDGGRLMRNGHPVKDEKFGLKMAEKASAVESKAPSIEQMIEEKRRKDAEAKAARDKLAAARRRRGPLSAAEKAARLASMQSDAASAQQSKDKRIEAWKAVDKATEQQEQTARSGNNGTFIEDVQARAFGMSSEGTLSQSVGRRAHYRQSSADINS